MDLQEFETRFNTEEHCLDCLVHIRWKNGYRCPRCNHNEMWEIKSFKYKCKKCGYQTTVLAGTLFQDTHLPITLWFQAILCVSKNNRISAAGLQKELGLGSNRTALTMLNKINRAKFRPVLEKLQGTIEVYRSSIRLNNKLITIVVAVEINNKTTGKIRLGIVESILSEKINSFIANCVKPQSEIICSKWHGFDKLIRQGYTQGKRAVTYEFQAARKISSKIEHWLYTLDHTENIADYLDQYCMIYNSLRSNISFEELLKNAVFLPPIPYADNLFCQILNKKIGRYL